jgi:hypothetical protein
MSRAAGLEGREETVVPKSKKQSRKTETAEDVQKLYARTYGSRLARQVGEVGPGYSRRATIVASLHRLNNESAALLTRSTVRSESEQEAVNRHFAVYVLPSVAAVGAAIIVRSLALGTWVTALLTVAIILGGAAWVLIAASRFR